MTATIAWSPLSAANRASDPPAASHPEQTSHLVIVGCGPRGLWALQELLGRRDDLDSPPPLDVTIVEPHQSPGAGWIYDPRQSSVLRMNLANRLIAAGDRSFVDWGRDCGLRIDPDGYAPRAQVGRYLEQCYRETLAKVGPGMTVSRVCDRVTGIRRTFDGWQLRRRFGPAIDCDELLITIGHTASGPVDDAPCDIAGIFPTGRRLDEEHVAAGSTVAIRGFALTGIDAMLALTEGRGGRFEPREDGSLRYVASGREPAAIVPFSRTGQPMDVKTLPAISAKRGTKAIWQRGLEALAETPPSVPVIESIVLDAAAARWKLDRLSQRMNTAECGPGGLWQCLRRRLWSPGLAESVVADWRQSLAEATGQQPLGIDQSLGAAWKHLYGGIVDAVSYGRLPRQQIARFRKMAGHFERFAFGPPAASVRRVLALVEAGLVRFDMAAGPQIAATDHGWQLTIGERTTDVDLLVDARIAPPGYAATHAAFRDDQAHDRRESPLADLVENGFVQVDPDWDAISVDPDGTAADGVAIIGRVTEGWVLGHDTLSRSLHDVIPRWAARVATKRRETTAAAVPASAAAR